MEENQEKELLKSIFDELTDQQKEMAKACRDTKELADLLSEQGEELPDELLEAVAGGEEYWHLGRPGSHYGGTDWYRCPRCNDIVIPDPRHPHSCSGKKTDPR